MSYRLRTDRSGVSIRPPTAEGSANGFIVVGCPGGGPGGGVNDDGDDAADDDIARSPVCPGGGPGGGAYRRTTGSSSADANGLFEPVLIG